MVVVDVSEFGEVVANPIFRNPSLGAEMKLGSDCVHMYAMPFFMRRNGRRSG